MVDKIITLPKIFQPFYCEPLTRLGKDNDGGYLVNAEDIFKTDCLVSLGIGGDWSFESDFLDKKEVLLDAYDESVDITSPAYKNFFKGSRKHTKINVGNKGVSIENILKHPQTFLKCDIDGGEYDILDSIINGSSMLSGIVLEVHSINNPINFNNITNFISKVNLKLVHLHVNNYFYYKTETKSIPDILELTFTSSKNIFYKQELSLPHSLDMVNNPDDYEFQISF